MTTVPPRRGGVTLIELLTVIAVIGIIAAIGTAAYMAATGGQRDKNTDATLQKLHALMTKRYTVLFEEARAEVKAGRAPASLMTVCDNDPERAAAVWAYLKLKVGMPTTHAEASADAAFTSGANTVTHPKLAIFGSGLANAGTPEEQSATCLFLALTKGGAGGVAFDIDAGLQQNIQEGPAGSVFVDGYGKPIAFVRMAYQTELNAPPFSPPTGTNRDPLDPSGRVPKTAISPALWTSAALASFWTAVTAGHIPGANVPPAYNGAQRWVPTLVSGGNNMKLGALFGTDDDGIDNLVSYRLRAGQKGN
ncbi:MAG: prepilin-type N-terminal cleavage/methylation domain-containing protein [Fimbriiglobus sp.]